MELSDTNLYSVTQYQVINGIIIRPLHFWRQILFQNLNRLVVCAAHIAYRRLNHQERSCSDQKRSRAASFLLCTHVRVNIRRQRGEKLLFMADLSVSNTHRPQSAFLLVLVEVRGLAPLYRRTARCPSTRVACESDFPRSKSASRLLDGVMRFEANRRRASSSVL